MDGVTFMLALILLHSALAESTSCSIDSSVLVGEGSDSYYVRGDLVNLREGPSTKNKVIAEIPLGTTVQVEACEQKESIGGKAGCWNSVSLEQEGETLQGYLFSTALSDCRIQGDFVTRASRGGPTCCARAREAEASRRIYDDSA